MFLSLQRTDTMYITSLFVPFPFQSLVSFPKIKRQVLVCQPEVQAPKEFNDATVFWPNQDFALV